MFRYLGRRFVKLGLYGLGICAAIGAWDFLQQTQAAEGNYSLQDYAASVSERYGDDASAAASAALELAQAGVAHGVTWAKSSGVLEQASGLLEQVGLDVAVPETQPVPSAAEIAVQSLDEPEVVIPEGELVALASADVVSAPETSLFPKARASR